MALNARELLIYISLKYNGDWNAMYEHIKSKKPVDTEEVHKVFLRLNDLEKGLPEAERTRIVAIVDPDYPDEFKAKPFCPFVLYYEPGEESPTQTPNPAFLRCLDGDSDDDDDSFEATVSRIRRLWGA